MVRNPDAGTKRLDSFQIRICKRKTEQSGRRSLNSNYNYLVVGTCSVHQSQVHMRVSSIAFFCTHLKRPASAVLTSTNVRFVAIEEGEASAEPLVYVTTKGDLFSGRADSFDAAAGWQVSVSAGASPIAEDVTIDELNRRGPTNSDLEKE